MAKKYIIILYYFYGKSIFDKIIFKYILMITDYISISLAWSMVYHKILIYYEKHDQMSPSR